MRTVNLYFIAVFVPVDALEHQISFFPESVQLHWTHEFIPEESKGISRILQRSANKSSFSQPIGSPSGEIAVGCQQFASAILLISLDGRAIGDG